MRVSLLFILATLAVLWIGSAAMYGDLPDRIPLHFNFAGEPDRWGPKSAGMWFLLPMVATAIGVVMVALSHWAARKPELINFPGKEDLLALPVERREPAIRHLVAMTDWIGVCVVVCLAVVQYAIYGAALGRSSSGMIPAAVLVGCVGPLVAILIQSARINRTVAEIRTRLRVLPFVAGLGGALGLSACARADAPARDPVRVAAASDLVRAFEAIGRDFTHETGQRVVFSFGSTGLLAKQLREGAPFDVFAAANIAFVREVVAAGVCDSTSVATYARGRIAIWSRAATAPAPVSVAELAAARYGRIAIANPEHAPYGVAAREALERAGIWDTIRPRIVYAENVRQALQFAETGNVDAAIVALPLVFADSANPWLPVDETMHSPIEQALAVCTGGPNRSGGNAFARYVTSDAGQRTLAAHGFVVAAREGSRHP